MSFISDDSHIKKLKSLNLNIKTKYIVGNKILERNTDNSHNDDIENGVRLEKQYYLKDKLVHTEKSFDTRMEYSFISSKEEETPYTCPNCGMSSKLKDFIDGCPYCRTYYNIDYTVKDLGSKYHYDRVLRSNLYRIITAVIDLIISIILSYYFIKATSRTFNNYDISKIFIYGTILALVLYYFFYILDAYIILTPLQKIKDKQNKKQMEFWNRTGIDKKTFFNNLNFEVRNKYYSTSNIVDYDILDFDEYQDYTKDNILYVKVKAYVRIITFDKKIKSKYMVDTYTMKRVNKDLLELKEGANIITCQNCGASVDALKGYCEHCNTKIKYLQEWVIE